MVIRASGAPPGEGRTATRPSLLGSPRALLWPVSVGCLQGTRIKLALMTLVRFADQLKVQIPTVKEPWSEETEPPGNYGRIAVVVVIITSDILGSAS